MRLINSGLNENVRPKEQEDLGVELCCEDRCLTFSGEATFLNRFALDEGVCAD